MLDQVINALGELSTPDQLVIGGAVISVIVYGIKSLKFTEKYHTVIASFVLPALVGALTALLGDKSPLEAGSALYVASQGILWVVRGVLAVYASSQTQPTAPLAFAEEALEVPAPTVSEY